MDPQILEKIKEIEIKHNKAALKEILLSVVIVEVEKAVAQASPVLQALVGGLEPAIKEAIEKL